MKGECDWEQRRNQREQITKGMMSLLGMAASFQSHVMELEDIRSQGNKMFTERNWAGAVSTYSECIDLARGQMDCINLAGFQLDIEGFQDKTTQEKYNHVLMLAYSNRAEARLRLREYEDAWHDAHMALQIDSKHVKSLVRKGKAAHGLSFFEKACKAFKRALAESPDEQSILKLLGESNVAQEESRRGDHVALVESRHGDHDLMDFFFRGCTGDIPSCADFVGPVEIRRASNGHWRWGLFATRDVEPGELLLASNPLASVRHMTLNPDGSTKRPAKVSPKKLLTELVERVRKSKMDMARLYSLANKGQQEKEVPSMEWFKPGSSWIPPDEVQLEVDVALIRSIANEKVFDFVDVAVPRSEGAPHPAVMGLWVLPAFAKHSCAPNCQHSLVGDTIFFRPSVHILEGEELTIAYFTDLFVEVEDRQAISKNWGFTCNCERCIFEMSVRPQFSRFSYTQECYATSTDFAKAARETEEFESVILSLSLSPRQRGWIRSAFFHVYCHNLAYVHGIDYNYHSSITVLRSMFDTFSSVYVTPHTLIRAAFLSEELDRNYSKQSKFYKDSLNELFSVFRPVFGKQPDKVLSKLIRKRRFPL